MPDLDLIEKKLSYIFSSDPSKGAFARNADGSEFSVNLNYPLAVPRLAKYCTIELHSASIWYVTPNVSQELQNNNFYFNDGVARTLTVQKGLYNLDQLVQSLILESTNLVPAMVIPFEDLFTIVGDDPTQKVVITFSAAAITAGATIDFTQPNNMGSLFGFDPQILNGVPPTVFGDNVAQFNQTNQYYIQSDLVHSGIPVNSQQSNVLGVVYIDVPPGELINFQPQQPLIINSDELIGGSRTGFRFRLTNEDGVLQDTNEEFWSFIVTIRYYIKI
jgi:hypothetical protein